MAKRKKKSRPVQQPAPVPVKKSLPIGWIVFAVLAVLAAVITLWIILASGGQGSGSETTAPVISEGPAPTVDTSKSVTMRIVKAGSAYVEPDENASTVFSFRKGDHVDVVSSEGGWSTIAVEGRPYYIPTSSLRAVDEYLIVIDAGHQLREDSGKEAITPGGAETAIRMEAGHTGVVTGQQEYDLTLAVSLKLQAALEARGYKVVMIRNHNAVNVSNVERAQVANKLYADAYISLHASSSDDADKRGIYTICQATDNSFNGSLYAQSKALATDILDATVKTTGAPKLDRKETNDLSGINWCEIPLAFVELGHLSCADEDRLLSTDEYRQKLANGIADGIDAFFTVEE